MSNNPQIAEIEAILSDVSKHTGRGSLERANHGLVRAIGLLLNILEDVLPETKQSITAGNLNDLAHSLNQRDTSCNQLELEFETEINDLEPFAANIAAATIDGEFVDDEATAPAEFPDETVLDEPSVATEAAPEAITETEPSEPTKRKGKAPKA